MSGNNTINVHVGTLEDMGQRFVEAWHRAERGEEINETHVTFHDLPSLMRYARLGSANRQKHPKGR